MIYSLHPLGDHAVMIDFGEEMKIETQQMIQRITSYLEKSPPYWLVEYIPAFSSIALFYHPLQMDKENSSILPYDSVCAKIDKLLTDIKDNGEMQVRTMEIPVCYGGEFGPDLETVAKTNGLTKEEVIAIHSSGDYLVYMIGFAPGFPYIGGMSGKIATPRRETPRIKIPARTVGIAGKQTGIYPIETPGGWQLIGRTPLKLFTPDEIHPSLLKAGDKIKFKPISQAEYKDWEKDLS